MRSMPRYRLLHEKLKSTQTFLENGDTTSAAIGDLMLPAAASSAQKKSPHIFIDAMLYHLKRP